MTRAASVTGRRGEMMAERADVAGPERVARVMLTAAVAAMGYLDYFQYKRMGVGEPGAWDALAAGRWSAPDQYRVSVVLAARWLAGHLHGRVPLAMALIDIVSALVAVHLLWSVLTRTAVYREASVELRWLGAAAFVLLPPWYFGWIFWLSKPETLPAAMLLAAMLWVWQAPVGGRVGVGGIWWREVALLGLTLVLASMRADEACFMCLGMAIAAWRRGGGLALPRGSAITTGVAGGVLAAGVQVWLAKVAFPQAHYGLIKFWQLWPNVHHASRWPPLVTFCLPVGWTAWQVWRRRFAEDTPGLGALLGAVLFFVLWGVIGKFDEVRVFLPFALVLGPMTGEMVMKRVQTREIVPRGTIERAI
jgi:hypothetical protein